MKKFLIPAVIVAVFGASVLPAFADRGGSSESEHGQQQSLGARITAKIQDVKDRIASRSVEFKAEVKIRLSDERKKHISDWWSRVQKRLRAVVGRESKVADRIQNRIDRLKTAGRDVTQVQADMNAARVKITVAQTAIASASADVTDIIDNNAPADAFKKLHDLQKGVLTALREAHRALVSVLAETRGLSVSPTPTPTP